MAPPASGRLYVVATPLGNLGDITLRALEVLRAVSLVACEDTRRTARLLQAHEIRTPTTSYFEHNERLKTASILDALRSGRDVALVSDAGTPGISDPGYRLVSQARAEGLPVIPVPGPNAAVAALSVSGLPTDRFLFVGFLPRKAHARRGALAELAEIPATLVVHESPARIVETLGDMLDVLGDRSAFLCREATKLHEEYLPGTLAEIRASLRSRAEVKGEVVLVVGGGGGGFVFGGTGEGAPPPTAESVEEAFDALVARGLTRREAVKEAARRLRLPAREVYRRVLDRGEGDHR